MLDAVVISVQVAFVATAMNLPVALLLSWLVVKKRVRGAFLLDILASLPLAVPPVVVGYMLLLMFGRRGPLGRMLEAALGWEIVFTWVAAAVAAAIVSFPLTARAIMVAMQGVDDRVERSARSLGAGPLRVALTITLPLAYRGIVAGALLGFVRAISEFGATIVVAGNIPGEDADAAAGDLPERAAWARRRGSDPGGGVGRAGDRRAGGAQLAGG